MAYFAPYIDATGIHTPKYSDVRDALVETARQIFGEDIYLENDSQDYELIASIAEKLNDGNELAVMMYNNIGPSSAIGPALDRVVKMNGISRKGQTHSICSVIITGDAGTKITGGIVADRNDNRWLVGDVIIPVGGQIEVTATCMESGPIYADADTIIRIVTQTRGWLAVTNKVNATPGQDVETDARLRSRQAISTANPSRTVLQGTIGGVASLLDVVRYKIYENDTNVPDKHGIPGHHISVVVEGGDDKEIAQMIRLRKTPGGGTYGDVEVDVDSSETNLAVSKPIAFFRPKYVDVHVQVEVKRFDGYVSQTETDIRNNICTYLNALEIGEKLTVSALYVPAMAATPSITAPVFSIQSLTIGTSFNDLSTENMEVLFNQVTRGALDNIRVIAE